MRMEEENSREAAEKLQQIGSSILGAARDEPVSYTHLTLPTKDSRCRSRWSPYH